jgi:hypothetical protein
MTTTSIRRAPALAALVGLAMLALSACGTLVGTGVGAGLGANAGDTKTGAIIGGGAGLIYDILN